jgi:hypothetical protein
VPRRSRTSNELRCFCARSPLLATFGLDEKGKLYVHVKIYKQRRVFGEVLVTEGKVQLKCRECLRWHTVIIREPGTAALRPEQFPPAVVEETPTAPTLAPPAPEP